MWYGEMVIALFSICRGTFQACCLVYGLSTPRNEVSQAMSSLFRTGGWRDVVMGVCSRNAVEKFLRTSLIQEIGMVGGCRPPVGTMSLQLMRVVHALRALSCLYEKYQSIRVA